MLSLDFEGRLADEQPKGKAAQLSGPGLSKTA
jgi:hypothetical protein